MREVGKIYVDSIVPGLWTVGNTAFGLVEFEGGRAGVFSGSGSREIVTAGKTVKLRTLYMSYD
jgi:hypothetical protein